MRVLQPLPSPAARASALLCWACLSLVGLSGCEAPSDPHPGRVPPPRLEPRFEPGPRPEPQPSWEPSRRALVALSIDPVGRISSEGERVHYLVSTLDEARRAHGEGVAVRLEVAPQTPWRDVDTVLDACQQVGLSNLHWRVAADPRPAVAWRLYPPERSPRAGVISVDWDAANERPIQRWKPLIGLLGPHDPEPDHRPLTRAELVREVRVSRARRVYLTIAPDVPFAEIFDTAEALRDTGTLLSFAAPR